MSLIVFRSQVDNETEGRQQEAGSANHKKWAGYTGGLVCGTTTITSCIGTGGTFCAVATVACLTSILSGIYHSDQEAEFLAHVKALKKVSNFMGELDDFLQNKADQMNEICGQSDTAVKRMNGLDRSIKMISK